MNKLTCVIPAYNEEKTIGSVVEVLRRVKAVDEILVVDDGSSDHTAAVASAHGATVERHPRNLGKGAAIKTGAAKAKHQLLLFIDADLLNITPAKIRKLTKPLKDGQADFVKASYSNASGRVTKLVAKPLLNIVYPFLKLKQPLSGEFGFRKSKFDLGKIEDGWGVDIQLVFQAVRRRLRIEEVFIGRKEHKHQSVDSLSKMSEQVMRTILAELNLICHKKKVVFFDLDETLIQESSITVLAKEWGFLPELRALQKRVQAGEIPDKVITQTLVRHFKGKTPKEVAEACSRLMHPSPFAAKVIESLRRQRYRVRIVSAAYSPVVRHFASVFNVYEFFCPRLARDRQGRYTGKLRTSRFEDKESSCCGRYVCKKKAVEYFMKLFKMTPEECIAVGDGKSDRCMFGACGMSLGFKTDEASQRIEQLSEVLMYAD